MELTDDNLLLITKYLNDTLSPDLNARLTAEVFLTNLEGNRYHPILLLNLINKEDIDDTSRIAAAIFLKNYIKKHWKVEDDAPNRIHPDDRIATKKLIVNVMLHSRIPAIQKQLSDAVSIIGKHDFPKDWPELIDEMVAKFNTGDFNVINGVLQTAHSIFKRYRYELKCQSLWEEIKFVLTQFAKPLTELFVATMDLTQVHDNKEALNTIYSSLLLICKVFYSLNFQDLPEYFEDHMEEWMIRFHILLTAEVPVLQRSNSEEPGVIEQLKSQVCDNVVLYAQKYDEEFQQYLPNFVTDIWSLLTSTGQEPKYDSLVSNALQFLATVADRAQYRHLFQDPTTLSNICEKVIIPNMEFRESDNELFEDNPEEYIRRDIEGSDVDTRRRAACDLVKVLSKYFEEKIMDIFGKYIEAMLINYAEKPVQNWRSKDAALYLVMSCTSKGQTQKHGVTQSSDLVCLPEFTTRHIAIELEKPDVNECPVIKADAIKFMMIFRSVLPQDQVLGCLPQLIRHLSATSVVVHSYAACAIEKILSLRGPNNAAQVKGENIEPFATDLLKALFFCLDKPGSIENEYVMKAIMKSFAILQDKVMPYLSDLLPKLTEKLNHVAKNPSRPNFNHYLFETLGLSIKIVCKNNASAVKSFEQVLYPTFLTILQQDVQEFIPYVFQILALLIELQIEPGIPENYMILFNCLLSPLLFERPANIHPLNRLLCAFVSHGAPQIIVEDKTAGLLGVFQKLIASKLNDHEGFLLIQTIIENFPRDVLEMYFRQIFILLFQRLTSSRTTQFVKGLIVFFSHYTIKYGGNDLINIIDGIQAEMFKMVLGRVIIADLQKVSGFVEKKITAVGMSNLLIDCTAMLNPPYNSYYPQLLAALIDFFELPRDESELPEDEYFYDQDTTPGYQAAYSQLIFARNPKKDPLQAIGDIRLHLAQGLSRMPVGQLPSLLTQIPEHNANHLRTYLQMAGVNIA